MTAPLLSASQMASLREVALAGMQTPISIYRRTLADSVYGDKETVSFTLVGSTLGWFFSRPTAVAELDNGMVMTVNTYRVFVPVGTNILSGDQVVVGVDTYVVSDTTAESTWLPLLNVTLRKRE